MFDDKKIQNKIIMGMAVAKHIHRERNSQLTTLTYIHTTNLKTETSFSNYRRLKAHTLTRSVRSPATCRSVVASSPASSRRWRCSERSSSAVITCTTCLSTTDLRSVTEICRSICRRASGNRIFFLCNFNLIVQVDSIEKDTYKSKSHKLYKEVYSNSPFAIFAWLNLFWNVLMEK